MRSSIWKATLKFFVVIPLLLVWGCEDADSGKENVSAPSENSGEKASPIIEKEFSFRLLNERVSDSAIKTEIEQNVLVSGIPTREGLENEILKRYREISSRTGFTYHKNPTNIYIYVYGTKEQAEAGWGLWIGMIAKSFNEKNEPKVSIDDGRLNALSAKEENKFGFSETDRKKIFKEMTDAEDRAMKEAMKQIPDSQFMKQIDLQRELEEKYETQLGEKYGLSKDQLFEIGVEGVTKGWPF